MRVVLAGVVGMLLVTGVAQAQDKAQVERATKVYAANKCKDCHSIGGVGNKKGPMDEVGTKLSPDEIRQWIVDATGMAKKANAKRKPAMKNYSQLPKEDVDALVAYLQTLKKG